MKIAIQGEAGSFSDDAAHQMLPRCNVVTCARSPEVFDRLERGQVWGAVIPIENTLAGSVAEHLDLLLARQVFAVREFRLRIVHNLIIHPEAKARNIQKVFSHPVALDQCRRFFVEHRGFEPMPFYDTAGSVKQIMRDRLLDTGAIASERAVHVYGARLIKRAIEDDKRNFTRFFLIRKQSRVATGSNKTSIAFALRNQPGALFKALSAFALRDISLSKIESRPVRGKPWEYVFYADFMRGPDKVSRHALSQLSEVADYVKVLGIYPAAS
jgi:prephenate dehydratase